MAFKIYSIESRKGGVGKSTIALNLASELIKDEELVLLLDCDITGTSIAEPAKNSPYWRDKTNVLSYVDDKGETKELNLIQYFLDTYVKGKGNCGSFIKEGNIILDKVNVIGSMLNGTIKEASTNSKWLMDELHSYWMVEFIQTIISESEPLYNNKMVHVIVDNSPGYNTFNLALHAFMYKIGPLDAKYLLVSTLDSQDLKANLETAVEITKNVDNRTRVAKYYIIKEKESEKKTEKETGKEIQNLEIERLIETNEDIKGFFFDLIENKQMLNIYSDGVYVNSDYISLVINKIPSAVRNNYTVVGYKEMLGNRFDFFLHISGSKDSLTPNNLIFYDESIVYQYYLQYLTETRETNTFIYWHRRFKELQEEVNGTMHMPPMIAMKKLTVYYNNFQSSLLERGYSHIATNLPNRRSPDYAFNTLKKNIASIKPIRDGIIKSEGLTQSEVKEILHKWNLDNLFYIRTHMKEGSSDALFIDEFISYLEKDVGYNDEKKLPDSMAIVSLLLFRFLVSFDGRDNDNSSVRDFILDEWRNGPFIKKTRIRFESDIILRSNFRVNVEQFMRQKATEFYYIYNRFCYTILKLIDQQEDFETLVTAVHLYVPSDVPMAFSKEMMDYLESVIDKKERKVDVNILYKIRDNMYFMKNIHDVLSQGVIKNWK